MNRIVTSLLVLLLVSQSVFTVNPIKADEFESEEETTIETVAVENEMANNNSESSEEAEDEVFDNAPENVEYVPEDSVFVETGTPIDANDFIVTDEDDEFELNNASNLPSSYSLLDEDAVTSVKNQGNYGTCWAFSVMASAESSYLKKHPEISAAEVDFSELHLVYYLYNNATVRDKLGLISNDYNDASNPLQVGGTVLKALYGISSGIGIVNEEELPYTEAGVGNLFPSNKCYNSKYAIENVNFYSLQDRETVKNAICNNGAIAVSIYYADSYLNTDSNAYYYPNSFAASNHMITIVGWDDNYSVDNFGSTKPSSKGAWLCKNSWGENWGDGGYFWLSYADGVANNEMAAQFIVDVAKDVNIYQYDGSASDTRKSIIKTTGNSVKDVDGSNAMKLANIYHAQKSELLDSVGFYTFQSNIDYKIEIYVNMEDSMNNPVAGTLVASATTSGKMATAGYHIVDLNTPVLLGNGTSFSIVLTISSTSTTPVSYAFDHTDATTLNVSYHNTACGGESFYYDYSSSSFNDFYYETVYNCDYTARIKGYTSAIDKLKLDRESITMELSGKETIRLTNATAGAIRWTTDNSAIQIENHGNYVVVTASNTVTAKVCVSNGELQTYCLVTVTPNNPPKDLGLSYEEGIGLKITSSNSNYVKSVTAAYIWLEDQSDCVDFMVRHDQGNAYILETDLLPYLNDGRGMIVHAELKSADYEVAVLDPKLEIGKSLDFVQDDLGLRIKTENPEDSYLNSVEYLDIGMDEDHCERFKVQHDGENHFVAQEDLDASQLVSGIYEYVKCISSEYDIACRNVGLELVTNVFDSLPDVAVSYDSYNGIRFKSDDIDYLRSIAKIYVCYNGTEYLLEATKDAEGLSYISQNTIYESNIPSRSYSEIRIVAPGYLYNTLTGLNLVIESNIRSIPCVDVGYNQKTGLHIYCEDSEYLEAITSVYICTSSNTSGTRVLSEDTLTGACSSSKQAYIISQNTLNSSNILSGTTAEIIVYAEGYEEYYFGNPITIYTDVKDYSALVRVGWSASSRIENAKYKLYFEEEGYMEAINSIELKIMTATGSSETYVFDNKEVAYYADEVFQSDKYCYIGAIDLTKIESDYYISYNSNLYYMISEITVHAQGRRDFVYVPAKESEQRLRFYGVTLLDGEEFNNALTTIAGGKANIKSVVFNAPSSTLPDGNSINLSVREGFVIAQYADNVVNIYSQTNYFMPEDCSSMFEGMINLQEIGWSSIYSNRVKNVKAMFKNCRSLALAELEPFFKNADFLENTEEMFYGCASMEVLDLNILKVDGNTKAENMLNFNGDGNSNQLHDLYIGEGFKLSGKDVNLSNPVKKNNVTGKWVSDFTGKALSGDEIPAGCGHYFIQEIAVYQLGSGSSFNDSLATIAGWDSSSGDSKTIYLSKINEINFHSFESNADATWQIGNYSNTINAKFDATSGILDIYSPGGYLLNANSQNMFKDCQNLMEINGLENVFSYNTTNMINMFANCSALEVLDLSNFDTSRVTSMYGMFDGCNAIKKINLESFNTANVTSMANMFKNCNKLPELDLSSFNTAKVNNTSYMFYGCTSLEILNIDNFSTKAMTANLSYCMTNMFAYTRNLKDLYIPSTVTVIGNYAFNSAKIERVHFASAEHLFGMDYYSVDDVVNSATIPSSSKNIDGTSFASEIYIGEDLVKDLAIPTTVEEVKPYVLYGCQTLRSITMSENTQDIGKCAFAYCANLVSVEVRSSNAAVGTNAFAYAKNLETVYIPGGACFDEEMNNDVRTSAFYSSNEEATIYTDAREISVEWQNYGIYCNDRTELSVIFESSISEFESLIRYNIRFNGNGATEGSMENMTYLFNGKAYTLSENAFTKPGAKFKCWNTKADESGTSYNDCDYVKGLATGNHETVTLYAIWEYKYKAPNPEITVDQYEKEAIVSLTDSDPNATIYYKFGNAVNYETYVSPFTTDVATATVCFYAASEGKGNSEVVTKEILAGVQTTPLSTEEGFRVLEIADMDYSPKIKKYIPEDVEVYDGNDKLVLNKDYTLKYSNNTKAGTATVTVTGKGNYADTLTATYNINPIAMNDENTVVVLSANFFTANTKAQKPTVKSVTCDGVKLKEKTDYTVVYSNASSKESGEYTISIIGKGNYSGQLDETYEISDMVNVTALKISGISNMAWTGNEIEQSKLEVKNGKVLLDASCYEIAYENNINVGTATMTITGVEENGYTGSVTKTFKITGTDISKMKYTAVQNYNYEGEKEYTQNQTITYTVKENGKSVAKTLDSENYSVTYVNNTCAGSAKVTYTGLSEKGYSGSKSFTFKIVGIDMKKVTVSNLPTAVLYNNEDVVLSGYSLTSALGNMVEGTDYTVTYKNNGKIGKGTITFTGINGYTGSVSKTFTINGISLKTVEYRGLATSIVYSADGNRQDVELYHGEEKLVEGTDYTVTYKNDAKVGTATITYKGIGKYKDSVNKTYKITKASLTEDMFGLSNTVYAYQKGGVKPTINSHTVTLNKDYTVKYVNNTKIGSAKVVITAKGNYSGTIELPFEIVMSDMSNVTISVADKIYSAKAGSFASTPVVIDSNGTKLAAKTDYLASYKYTYTYDTKLADGTYRNEGEVISSKDVVPSGTCITVTVTGTGNYAGETKTSSANYYIVNKSIASAKATIKSQPYTGKQVLLDYSDITLKVGKETLTSDDYKIVSYSNNTSKGTATVTLQGKGNYGGSVTVKFSIVSKSFTYTINFNANGGSGKMSTKKVSSACTFNLPANTFKKTGYTFAGWSINNTSSEESELLTDKEAVTVAREDLGKTVTLYAVWKKK